VQIMACHAGVIFGFSVKAYEGFLAIVECNHNGMLALTQLVALHNSWTEPLRSGMLPWLCAYAHAWPNPLTCMLMSRHHL
jgi:hypothetical protein